MLRMASCTASSRRRTSTARSCRWSPKLVSGLVNKDPMGSSTKTIVNLFENQMNQVSKDK